MSEPEGEGESDQFGDFLLHFLGHATFTEMLRITHEVYARNAADRLKKS